MKALLLTTTAAAILSLSPVKAATFTITDVGTSFADNSGIINGPGFDSPWTTPIILTTSTGETFTTYCDDLFNNITVEGGQALTYVTGLVTTNGIGGALTEATSNIMGQIAGIGLADLAKGNDDGSIAAQGAIWELEYGGPVTSTDATIQGDITTLLDTVHDDGTGFAQGLISESGTQDQILGSAAVPEPSTWVMLLMGIVGLSVATRKTRRDAISI